LSLLPTDPFTAPILGAVKIAQQVAEAVATVDEALTLLEEAAEELRGDDITLFSTAHFGSSWAGGNLGGHGIKAQSNVVGQLDQLAEGLRQYREDLVLSAKEMNEADETVATDARNLGTILEACGGSDFSTTTGNDIAAQCTPGGDA
jgi:hypothetical protein